MKKKAITEEEYKRAEANGISRKLLQDRVNTKGWNIGKAISTPVNANMRRGRG